MHDYINLGDKAIKCMTYHSQHFAAAGNLADSSPLSPFQLGKRLADARSLMNGGLASETDCHLGSNWTLIRLAFASHHGRITPTDYRVGRRRLARDRARASTRINVLGHTSFSLARTEPTSSPIRIRRTRPDCGQGPRRACRDARSLVAHRVARVVHYRLAQVTRTRQDHRVFVQEVDLSRPRLARQELPQQPRSRAQGFGGSR